MIDTQHKVSCHFRFIEQLICPDLFVQTALSTTGKVTAKLKEIEQTFCTPFNRQRTPVCNHVPFTTRHQFNGHCPTSLTECSLSCSERQSFFLEARESTLRMSLVIVNFDTSFVQGDKIFETIPK